MDVFVFEPGEGSPAAAVVTVLEASQVADEVVHLSGTFFAAKFLDGIEVSHHFGDGDAGEVFEEVAGFGLFEGTASFADALDAGFAELIGAPLGKAAVAPIGEVGSGDGLVSEFLGDEILGFGQGV